MSLASDLVAHFDADAPRTRALLAACPPERFDWKPHEKSMTLGQLAGHIAEAPGWTASMVEEDLDVSAMAGYVPFSPTGREELLSRFEEACASLHSALEGRTDEHMHGTWRMRAGEQVLMELPRHAVVRDFALHHGMHHRGQLSVYLRLLDVPLPETFGPTADSASPLG